MGSKKSRVAKLLKEEMDKRGLTYAEWALLLGVSVGCAHEWTTGVYDPPLKALRRIAKILKRDVVEFVS